MNCTAITQDILSDNRVQNSEFLKQLCTSTIAMYPNQLPMLPWVGYLAEKNGVFVGTCAYKSSPENGEVEIAYFTFPEYEGQGVATLMAQWLLNIANQHGVSCVKAQTLPVWAVGRHCVDRIRDKDDSRAQRDRVARESAGITLPIPPLVVVAD